MEVTRLLAAGAGQLGLGMAGVAVAQRAPMLGRFGGPIVQLAAGYAAARFGGGLLRDAGHGGMIGATAALMLSGVAAVKGIRA
jgi:hypothetical protein